MTIFRSFLSHLKFSSGDIITRSSLPGYINIREVAMVLPYWRGVVWLYSPFHEPGSISGRLPFEEFQVLSDAWCGLYPALERYLNQVQECFVTKAPCPSLWEYPFLLLAIPPFPKCLPPTSDYLTWPQWAGWLEIKGHFSSLPRL